jgi:hypothetical protein
MLFSTRRRLAVLMCAAGVTLVAQAEAASTRLSLPPGTQACDLTAWSMDSDLRGLNVRSEPAASSPILGTLSPPLRTSGSDAEAEPYRTEFRIRGYKTGWFLIEGATPPGSDYEDPASLPLEAPKPFSGRGWVAASKIGASFANGGTRAGGLFAKPSARAPWRPAREKDGSPIQVGGFPKRILACSGSWAEVESQDGVRGWWLGLCSNQVTHCS